MGLREGPAFHGIFFRHQDRLAVGRKIVWHKGVVIGKRMLDHLQALRTQACKKSRRVSDRSDRMHDLTGEIRQWLRVIVD